MSAFARLSTVSVSNMRPQFGSQREIRHQPVLFRCGGGLQGTPAEQHKASSDDALTHEHDKDGEVEDCGDKGMTEWYGN